MNEIEELGYTLSEVNKMTKSSSEFSDFCYQIAEKCGYDSEKLEMIAANIGVLLDDILRKARNYKNMDRFNYQDEKKAKQKRDAYISSGYSKSLDEFMEKLLNTEKEEDLIDFFNENRKYLRSTGRFMEYLVNMYPFDYREKLLDIKRKIQIYRDYLTKQNEIKKGNKANFNDEASKIANEILNDYEVKRFHEIADKYKLSKDKMQLFANCWKEIEFKDNDDNVISLYDKIALHLKENRYEYYNDNYGKNFLKVLELVNKPIYVGDYKRSFDELDCYTFFREPLPKIHRILRELFSYDNSEENKEKLNNLVMLKKLLNFNNLYYPWRYNRLDTSYFKDIPDSLQELSKEKILVSNFYSPILERDLTLKEKENILNEMIINNIPITFDAFNYAINRYHNGHLELITKENIDSYLEKGKSK